MPQVGDPNFRAVKRILLCITGIALLFLFVWYAWELLFLAFAGLLLAIILRAMSDWARYFPKSLRCWWP